MILLLGKLRNLNFDIFCKQLELGKLKTWFWYSKNGKCPFRFNGKSLVKKWHVAVLVVRGVVPSFPFVVSVAASQKYPILSLQKWKMYFSWDETKIVLCGVPRHLKGHARVRYDPVSINYDMIRAKSSSFDQKAMQPRTWYVIFVRRLSGKLLLSRFYFPHI
jgi:hypothetical protein